MRKAHPASAIIAKKVYTNCTAAVLRAKDCVMKTVDTVQENAEDILAEAKQINAKREEAFQEELEETDSSADGDEADGQAGAE